MNFPGLKLLGRLPEWPPAQALALALRREDPDTLFFKRRLVMTGDTDLGLVVKNALDAIDWSRLPWPLRGL